MISAKEKEKTIKINFDDDKNRHHYRSSIHQTINGMAYKNST
jgi:hypothetical protein